MLVQRSNMLRVPTYAALTHAAEAEACVRGTDTTRGFYVWILDFGFSLFVCLLWWRREILSLFFLAQSRAHSVVRGSFLVKFFLAWLGCPQDPKENSFPAQKGTHAANLMLASSNRREASSVGGPSD